MKYSYRDLLGILSLMPGIKSKELSKVVSYVLTSNVITIENTLKSYEEARQKLLSEYTIPGKDDEGRIFKNEDCEHDWKIDIENLLNVTVEVSIRTVPLSCLTDSCGNDIYFSYEEMRAIYYMIEV